MIYQSIESFYTSLINHSISYLLHLNSRVKETPKKHKHIREKQKKDNIYK